MSSPSIQSALQQMQGLAAQAAQPIKGEQLTTSVGQSGFGSELQASIQRINRMQKASVAFQMGMQVRNRLVTAYRDVMNMQV